MLGVVLQCVCVHIADKTFPFLYFFPPKVINQSWILGNQVCIFQTVKHFLFIPQM